MSLFTFYYIYIKTAKMEEKSNMELIFTFYYIYIKTNLHFLLFLLVLNLHSTIFILKHSDDDSSGLLANIIYILLYLY